MDEIFECDKKDLSITSRRFLADSGSMTHAFYDEIIELENKVISNDRVQGFHPHLRYPMQENQLDIHLPRQEETTIQIPTITLQCQSRLANHSRNPLLSLLYLQSNKIQPKTSIHTAKCRRRSYACNSMHYNRNNAL